MQDVVFDACCVINLYAAGTVLSAEPSRPKLRRKAAAHSVSWLDFKLHLPAKVKDEAKYVLQPDEEDENKLTKAEIDLAPLIKAGIFHECNLTGNEEAELFVQIATKLDDGEAVCFAIAKNRGWLLATDERPTENLAKTHGVTIVTTPELVKHWATMTKATEDEVAAVLWNIQTFAHYFPRKTLPLHFWWMDLVKKAKKS